MSEEIPIHGKKFRRPADAFMAEQAAMVAPRRIAFERLDLMREHHERLGPVHADLPDLARADPRREPANLVRVDGELERPGADAGASFTGTLTPVHAATESEAPSRVGDDERPAPEFAIPDAPKADYDLPEPAVAKRLREMDEEES